MFFDSRFSRATLRNLFVVSAFAAWAAMPAAAQTNVTLDDLVTSNGKSSVSIKHLEFVGTNLTQDEVKTLITSASPQEAAALLQKLEAKQILIPEAVVAPADKSGAITLRGFQANDIAKGKVARLSLGGVDGSVPSDKGGRVTIKAGALTVDNLEAGALIATLGGGDPFTGLLKATRVASNGIELTVPDSETPADAPGGNLIKLTMASFGLDQTYDGDIPARSSFAINGLVVELPKASKAGAQLAAEGYDRIEASLHFGGSYDSVRKAFAIDDLSIEAPKVASVRLKGQLGDIDKTIFAGGSQERAAALMGGSISALDLRIVNSGAFEKIVEWAAKDQKKTSAQMTAEWKAMTLALAQAFGQGDPVAARAAEAASNFLANPKSLSIAVKGKGGPVKFMDIAASQNPAELLKKIDVDFATETPPVGAAPATVAQAPAAPAVVEKLKGMAAWSAVVGNTIAGKDSDGEPLFEFYAADGRLKQLDDDTLTGGKWALKGQKVCIVYSGEGEETCYQVEVFGDTVTFIDEDGDGLRYKILKGNPKNL